MTKYLPYVPDAFALRPVRPWRHVLVLLLLIPLHAEAQPADTTRHFPLEVGNTWTYFQVLYPPDAPPDTSWRGTYSIAEAVSIHDTLYVVAPHPFSLADTLRTDGEGRIWARLRGDDVLLFDFTLPEGETYLFEDPYEERLTYQVSIERGDTIDVGAGRFEDVVRLRFDDPQWVDEGHTFAFAPGVGIVYAYGPGGDYEELYSAEVGGRVITATEETTPPSREAMQAVAYPNPFPHSTTILMPAPGALHAAATIVDALGRTVATLRSRGCDGHQCRFTWDASQLPSGVYFVLSDRGETIPLILRR